MPDRAVPAPSTDPAYERRNSLRHPVVETNAPLRKVTETVSCDPVVRVERLECGHHKTTLTASSRPALRRRCFKCLKAGAA